MSTMLGLLFGSMLRLLQRNGDFDGIALMDAASCYILGVDIVTTYIPQRDQWIKSQVRKKRRG